MYSTEIKTGGRFSGGYLKSVISIFIIFSSLTAKVYAGHNESEDVGVTLLHHIMDSHSWQPVPFLKPLQLHDLQIGPLAIPVTQYTLMLLIIAAVLIVVFAGVFHKVRTIPSRVGIMLEPLVFFVRDSLIYPAMGEETGKKWLPFCYTLFFFILGSNFLGMIPMFRTVTGNLSVNTALAVMVFVIIVINGVRKLGIPGFFTAMIPEGVPGPIAVLLLVVEVANLFIRSGVLAIRLFANMIAGHMVISSLLLLIFLIHPIVSAVSVPMALFIYLLEVLVAIIQAVVFTMLSAVFIKMASSHH
ncbi:MAG: F0F1 ATP synthase subunit A [Chitinispirillaceae bacterium]|nr:F0F1 ATP synthase subunit A [Chitinispirillaceae bacterium]